MLAHEGFVQVQPRQGYRVSDITLGDVQEVFQMRMLLEPAAAELAAERASADQLKRLSELAEESYVYGELPTYEGGGHRAERELPDRRFEGPRRPQRTAVGARPPPR